MHDDAAEHTAACDCFSLEVSHVRHRRRPMRGMRPATTHVRVEAHSLRLETDVLSQPASCSSPPRNWVKI
eukprot:1173344-Prymnesium_polylepis.1